MRFAQYIATLVFFVNSASAQLYTDRLKSLLDSALALKTEDEPGFCVYIERANQILYSNSQGVTNISSKQKFDELTLSNLGGISKTFIGYSILILQQQGKLNIEDSIYKYLPDIKNKDIAKKIKIRHLLTHTSGIKDLPFSPSDSVFSLEMNDEQNFELVKYSNKLSFEPGNNYSYSDQAFSALVLIIEKVTKAPWQKFVQEYIFAPTGMTYSKFTQAKQSTSGVANGYRLINNTYSEYDEGECPKMFTATNAGIWSNINDLRKYMYGLKYCLFLKCETVALSEKIITPVNWYSPQKPPQSYCWMVNQPTTLNPYSYIEYSGKQGGYRSQIIFFPDKDLTIIWLSNNGKNYSEPILQILKKNGFLNK